MIKNGYKLWLILFLLRASCGAVEKPNFIIILTDDHGWSSLSSSMDLHRPEAKSDYHQTPNMDALLDKGMRFSNGYAASPVCSPTRYSIQFGKSPARLHRTRVLGGNKADHNQMGIPNLLKSVHPEYRCAHFGKWHIDEDPGRYGYDEHDGRTANKEGGFSHSDHQRQWGGYAEADPKRVHSITERTVDFMRRSVQKGNPFFVQLSHYAVHSDIVYCADSLESVGSWPKGKLHKSSTYAAMMLDLDQSIGTLLAAYESLGLAENTYLIFLADNGGMPVLPMQVNEGRPYKAGLNLPLLRGKWDLTEGGIRVPFAIVGPGIAPSSQSDTPVISYDLFPTLADIVGAVDALPENLDGGSLRPLFDDSAGEVKRPFEGLVFHFPHYNIVGLFEPHSAIRVGDYKLLKFYSSKRSLLFNVAEDIGESTDLSSKHPERKAEMEVLLADYLERVKAERPEDSSSWAKGQYGAVRTKFLRRYSE